MPAREPAGGPPHSTVTPNTPAFLAEPMIVPAGFRDYDARWRYPQEINLPGLTALGLGLATQMRARGGAPEIIVGCDYRSYSPEVKQALILGLVAGGVQVRDIGVALSPMAYFARDRLGVAAVAMVTASHNPDGWTGVKMGLVPPFTHGTEEMAELRDIVLSGKGEARPGGGWHRAEVAEAWLADLAGDFRLSRRLRVVCATGNGTAGAFLPELLSRLGAEVTGLRTEPDYSFPAYTPNPEGAEMLADMGRAVRAAGADIGLGFDGDGDRCGVVDETGTEIPGDKMGVLLARDLARRHPGAHFLADMKSTALFLSDPELARHGATAEHARTGHSHMKRRLAEAGALAAFEKSGHFFFAPPVGRGYDCAGRAAVEILRLLEAEASPLSACAAALPASWTTPMLAPPSPDTEKHAALARVTARLQALAAAGGQLGGRRVAAIGTLDGARAELDGGGWALVRASSNTPNLVVAAESLESAAERDRILADLGALLAADPAVSWPPPGWSGGGARLV